MSEEAIAHYEAVVRLDPYNFAAYAAIVGVLASGQQGSDEEDIAAVKRALRARGSDPEAAPGMWATLLTLQTDRCDWSTWYPDRTRLATLVAARAAAAACELPPLLPLRFLLPAALAVNCAKAASTHVQARLQATATRSAAPPAAVQRPHNASSVPNNSHGPHLQVRLRVGFVSGAGFGNESVAGRLLLGPTGWLGAGRRSWVALCICLCGLGEVSAGQLMHLGCDEVHGTATDGAMGEVAEEVLKAAASDVLVHVGGTEDEKGAEALATGAARLQVTPRVLRVRDTARFAVRRVLRGGFARRPRGPLG